MGRTNYKPTIKHQKQDKKTSVAGRKSRIKTSSMNKNKKRSYKPYKRQGK